MATRLLTQLYFNVQERSSLRTLWNTSKQIISHLELEINEKNKIIKDPKIIDEVR